MGHQPVVIISPNGGIKKPAPYRGFVYVNFFPPYGMSGPEATLSVIF
jgi:hypothetical protein